MAQPAPKPSSSATPAKGKKPPAWAWVAAVAIGLVVGYVFLRRGSGSSSSSSSQPQGQQAGQDASPGLSVPDYLQALGVKQRSTDTSQANGVTSDGGGVGDTVAAADAASSTPDSNYASSPDATAIAASPTYQPDLSQINYGPPAISPDAQIDPNTLQQSSSSSPTYSATQLQQSSIAPPNFPTTPPPTSTTLVVPSTSTSTSVRFE